MAVNKKIPVLSSNEVTLVIRGEAIAESSHRRLERAKYVSPVAKHLKIDNKDFDRIDWAAHEFAVKRVDSPAAKRILWRHHPTRVRLHMQRRHSSPDYPLCGEKDHAEHFVYCSVVNDSPRYQSVVQDQSHPVHKKGSRPSCEHDTAGYEGSAQITTKTEREIEATIHDPG